MAYAIPLIDVRPVVVPRSVRVTAGGFEFACAVVFNVFAPEVPTTVAAVVDSELPNWPMAIEKIFAPPAGATQGEAGASPPPLAPAPRLKFKGTDNSTKDWPVRIVSNAAPVQQALKAWQVILEKTFAPASHTTLNDANGTNGAGAGFVALRPPYRSKFLSTEFHETLVAHYARNAEAGGVELAAASRAAGFGAMVAEPGAINPAGATALRPRRKLESVDSKTIRDAYQASDNSSDPNRDAKLKEATLQRERSDRRQETACGVLESGGMVDPSQPPDFFAQWKHLANHSGLMYALRWNVDITFKLTTSEADAFNGVIWLVMPELKGISFPLADDLISMTQFEFSKTDLFFKPAWPNIAKAWKLSNRLPKETFWVTQEDFSQLLENAKPSQAAQATQVPEASAARKDPPLMLGGGVGVHVDFAKAYPSLSSSSAAEFLGKRLLDRPSKSLFNSLNAITLQRGFTLECAPVTATTPVWKPLCARRTKLFKRGSGGGAGELLLEVEEEAPIAISLAEHPVPITGIVVKAPAAAGLVANTTLTILTFAEQDRILERTFVMLVVRPAQPPAPVAKAARSAVTSTLAVDAAAQRGTQVRGSFKPALTAADVRSNDHVMITPHADPKTNPCEPIATVDVFPVFKEYTIRQTTMTFDARRFTANNNERIGLFLVIASQKSTVILDNKGAPVAAGALPLPVDTLFTIEGERRAYVLGRDVKAANGTLERNGDLSMVTEFDLGKLANLQLIIYSGAPYARLSFEQLLLDGAPNNPADRVGILTPPFASNTQMTWLLADGPGSMVRGKLLPVDLIQFPVLKTLPAMVAALKPTPLFTVDFSGIADLRNVTAMALTIPLDAAHPVSVDLGFKVTLQAPTEALLPASDVPITVYVVGDLYPKNAKMVERTAVRGRFLVFRTAANSYIYLSDYFEILGPVSDPDNTNAKIVPAEAQKLLDAADASPSRRLSVDVRCTLDTPAGKVVASFRDISNATANAPRITEWIERYLRLSQPTMAGSIDAGSLAENLWIEVFGIEEENKVVRARSWPQYLFGTLLLATWPNNPTLDNTRKLCLGDSTITGLETKKFPDATPRIQTGFVRATIKNDGTFDFELKSEVAFRMAGEIVEIAVDDENITLTLAAIPPLAVIAPSAYDALPRKPRFTWKLKAIKFHTFDSFDSDGTKMPFRCMTDLELGECLYLDAADVGDDGCFHARVAAGTTLRLRVGVIGKLKFAGADTEHLLSEGSAEFLPAELTTPMRIRRTLWLNPDASYDNHVISALAPPLMFARRITIFEKKNTPRESIEKMQLPATPMNGSSSDLLGCWRGWPISVPLPGLTDENNTGSRKASTDSSYFIHVEALDPDLLPPTGGTSRAANGQTCRCNNPNCKCGDHCTCPPPVQPPPVPTPTPAPAASKIGTHLRRSPRLRYTHKYQFRLAYTDLAGNNLLADLHRIDAPGPGENARDLYKKLYIDIDEIVADKPTLANPIQSHADPKSPDGKAVSYRRPDDPGVVLLAFSESSSRFATTSAAPAGETGNQRPLHLMRFTHPVKLPDQFPEALAATFAERLSPAEVIRKLTQASCAILPPSCAVETAIAHGALDTLRDDLGALIAQDDQKRLDFIADHEKYLTDGRLICENGKYNYLPDPATLQMDVGRDSADVTIQTADIVVDESTIGVPAELTFRTLGKSWPNLSPINVTLADRVSVPAAGQQLSRDALTLVLGAGRRGGCTIASYMRDSVEGRTPVRRELRLDLIHAATSPVARPQWSDNLPGHASGEALRPVPHENQPTHVQRDPGSTSQDLQLDLTLDAPSTGAVSITAYWNDYWDESVSALFIPAKVEAGMREISQKDGESYFEITRCKVVDPGAGYGSQVLTQIDFKGNLLDGTKSCVARWRANMECPRKDSAGVDAALRGKVCDAILNPVVVGGRIERIEIVFGGRYRRAKDLKDSEDMTVDVQVVKRLPLYQFAVAQINYDAAGHLLKDTVEFDKLDPDSNCATGNIPEPANESKRDPYVAPTDQQRGSFYVTPPIVVPHDLEGNGYGAKLAAVLDDAGRIARIDLLNPGEQYGMQAGRTWRGGTLRLGIYTHSRKFQESLVPNRQIAARAIVVDQRLASARWEQNDAAVMLRSTVFRKPPIVVAHDLDSNGFGAVIAPVMDTSPASGVEGTYLTFNPTTPFEVRSGGSNYSSRVAIGVYVDDMERTSNPIPLDARQNFSMQFEHPFGDLKSRLVQYVASASSRFRDIVDEKTLQNVLASSNSPNPGLGADELQSAFSSLFIPRFSVPRAINIPGVMPVSQPIVDYIIPVFKWNKSASDTLPSGSSWGATRETMLRVYLERDWHVTGKERLGVVILAARNNSIRLPVDNNSLDSIPLEYRSLISRWGYDPAWDAADLPPLRLDDLTNQDDVIEFENLAEFDSGDKRTVGVCLFEVQYDLKKDRWYADIGIKAPPESAPFVQLALVRYQKFGTLNFKMSQVTRPDMILLMGARTLTAKREMLNSKDTISFRYEGNFEKRLKGSAAPRNGGDVSAATAIVGDKKVDAIDGNLPHWARDQVSRRKVVVEFRKRSLQQREAWIEGDLQHVSLGGVAEKIDVLELKMDETGAFTGSREYVEPLDNASGENIDEYVAVKEYEVYQTSSAQLDKLGHASRVVSATYPRTAPADLKKKQESATVIPGISVVDRLVFCQTLTLNSPPPKGTFMLEATHARLTYAEVTALVQKNNNSTLSVELIVAIAWKETSFDPAAKNPGSTATGLLQMTKDAVTDVNQNTPAGVHFEHSEMKDGARNIACGTYYLNLLVGRWGTTKSALEHFGTGAGYADDLLACETCLKNGGNSTTCLSAIHP